MHTVPEADDTTGFELKRVRHMQSVSCMGHVTTLAALVLNVKGGPVVRVTASVVDYRFITSLASYDLLSLKQYKACPFACPQTSVWLRSTLRS
jgi:hypothetical protein